MNRYAQGIIPVMVPQQFMAVPRATVPPLSGMSDYNRQSAAQLLGAQSSQPPSHRGPSGNQDFRQRDDDRSGNRFSSGRRPGNRWQSDTEVELDEPNLDESLVVLDHFNSDLHLVIDPDGYGGSVLNDPPGFCFTWAGARATYGVCRGKVFYEVHVVEHLPADFGDDHNETDPHIIRLGWSVDSSSFQLGEEPWSYGYGGTGKFSTNNRFTDYGGRFQEGDVIGAMLDLESRPPTVSYMKNGTWLGVAAPLHGIQVGSKEKALFPHILSKNCRFKVNFGQMDAWYPPPMGFRYIGHLPLTDRVRGMVAPARKSDCEMIMIVGLPGAGKTTWGITMEKNHPEKRYNIIGTDTLIEKMRVMGLPRKRNYHGRWEVLIDKATKCLNKLFAIAAKRRRNYILDQTNVYGTARRRKMRNFAGFYRIAAVIQPDDPELERRSYKRTHEDGKVVPESAVLEMKANFSIPEDRDNLFDRVDFVELKRDVVQQLVKIYNDEGKTKKDDSAQNRFDSTRKPGDQRQQQYGGYKPPGYGQSSFDDKNFDSRKREHGYFDQNEPAVKRDRQDSGAYDAPKHQYEEVRQPLAQQASVAGRSAWSDPTQVKEEPGDFYAGSQWSSAGYTQGLNSTQSSSLRPGLLGALPTQGQSQYGTSSQGYGSQFDKDSSRQQAPWQQEQKETSLRSQDREPGTAIGSWESGWKGRDDGQGLTSRNSGSQDLAFSQRGNLDREGDRDRSRGRDGERDRIGDKDRDRERDQDRNWDRNSDYNRSISDRGGYSSNDRSRQDVGTSGYDLTRQGGGYSSYDSTRQDAGFGGYDRLRQDGAYGSTDRTRQDEGYGSTDRTRLDGAYGSTDRTRLDGAYGSTDRIRLDEAYGSTDRTRLDGAYSSTDRTRLDGVYGSTDRTRLDGAYGSTDRTHLDGAYGSTDRTRLDGAYSGSDRSRLDGAYSGTDRTRLDGAYGGTDRTRLDGAYGGPDRTRLDGAYGGTDRTRLDGAYSGPDSTRLDGAYGGTDRTRLDGAYGGTDRTRLDGTYGGTDRTYLDGAYGGTDRTRLDGAYGGTDRTRLDGAYGGTDRTRLDGAYGGTDRTRLDGAYGGTDRTRLDGAYGGTDRTRLDGAYGNTDRARPDGGYASNDRTRQDGGYSNIDRTRSERVYTQDSASAPLNIQGYGSGATPARQSYEATARKSDPKPGYTSRWGLPGQDQAALSDQIKKEVDVDEIASTQKTFSQSTGSVGRVSRFSSATNTNVPQGLPPSGGNIKTEFVAAFEKSSAPDIKKSSISSVLGQPGLKPLIPVLESDQLRKEKHGTDHSKARQTPAVEKESSQPKKSNNSTSNSRKALPADNTEDKLTKVSEDKKAKPLASPEEKKPELPIAAAASSSKGSTSTPSKEEADKAGQLPASDTVEAARDPWNGPSQRPRGTPWQMDRFPGPGDGMESRRPPRGPSHYGSFGGPPRGPVGGPPHGFRGPGPWNQNHPRFGPQGPSRPYFSGPPGRWPRPPR